MEERKNTARNAHTSSVVGERFKYRALGGPHPFTRQRGTGGLIPAKHCVPVCGTEGKDDSGVVTEAIQALQCSHAASETPPRDEQVTLPKGPEGFTKDVAFELAPDSWGLGLDLLT